MKKLKFNKTEFAGAQVLSRADLKKITGGKQLTCWCNSGSGGFSPHPDSTGEQLMGMMEEYCNGTGATCS
ncbi:hypothetical protein [Pedobacter nototheniae]|uniref:hypothetical protein n=1 Tax=Pedobacter nototheniae TaxID=2488994 RepID=UPI00292D914C|nr:hypothetical protein [Pedobacter nototheniae]